MSKANNARCPSCQYDLSGISPTDDTIVCPECGHAWSWDQVRPRPKRLLPTEFRVRNTILGLGLVLVVLLLGGGLILSLLIWAISIVFRI